MKVLSIFGTRPEAIKMAPILRAFENNNQEFQSRICVTAQHRDMLDQVLALFEIKPDYDLNLMRPGQTPLRVAAQVLEQLEGIISQERPDWVLVQGDTTTAMAASIAAFYSETRIGHIEAGLRTKNRNEPFPEEINRRLTSVVADLHFAPTERSRHNLLNEGIPDALIAVTGNPVIDALQWVAAQPYDFTASPLSEIPWDRHIILVTAHRRENFGKPLLEVCTALRVLASEYYKQIHIIFPVHPNPNVQETINRFLNGIPNVTLTPPLDYLSLAHLMRRSYLVLTDSGGIQEEAPSFGKPVLVLRNVTERQEAVEAGTVELVGTDQRNIIEATKRLLENRNYYQKMARSLNPYGDGHAAQRICQSLLSHS